MTQIKCLNVSAWTLCLNSQIAFSFDSQSGVFEYYVNTERGDLNAWRFVIVCKDDPTNSVVDTTVVQESPQFDELAFSTGVGVIDFGLLQDSVPIGQSWIAQYTLEFSKGPCGEIELEKARVSWTRVHMYISFFQHSKSFLWAEFKMYDLPNRLLMLTAWIFLLVEYGMKPESLLIATVPLASRSAFRA